MSRIKFLYVSLITISIVVSLILIWILILPTYYLKAALLVIIPMAIVIVGLRLISNQKIKIIRNQLYQILHHLEEFDIDNPKKVKFEDSQFPIFNELNVYLIELIDRIRKNYQANKQFTQNASHELQTPLAIIKGHVEILIQSPKLGEKEFKSLAVVLQNTNRLSKLNGALILLSKIEHQRFGVGEKVDLAELTKRVLKNFHDVIQIQDLVVKMNIKEKFEIEMSSSLAEILIANLVQNAIRHNIEEGHINIHVDADNYVITNPGKTLKVSTASLFQRFEKDSDSEESLGLGLSIVKRICDHHALEVNYKHANNMHTIHIEKAG